MEDKPKQLSIEDKLDLIIQDLLTIKGRLSSIESRMAAQSETTTKNNHFGWPDTHE